MALPIFQTSIKELSLMETQWASQLNPLLANPILSSSTINGVNLVSGDNVINTKLGKKAQGWYITDINAASSIYRSKPFNELTLTLNASAPATINLVIF